MSTWYLLVAALGLVPLWLFALVARITFHLLRTRVRKVSCATRPGAEVPAWFREAVASTVERCAVHGFAPLGFFTAYPPGDDGHEGLSLSLADPTGECFLTISRAEVPEDGRLTQLYVETAFADGTKLLTADRPVTLLVRADEGNVLQASSSPTPGEVIATHRRRLGTLRTERTPVVLPLEGWLARYDDEMRRSCAADVASGELVEETDGFRPSVRYALASAFALVLRRPGRTTVEARGPLRVEEPAPEPERPSAELLASAFRVVDAVWRRPVPRKVGIALFLATFAVSAAAAIAWLGPFMGSVLLGTLAFHEGGHLVAMLAFGYRETRVFFVPFLGAAVTGQGAHATAMQRGVVLLLGPAPGLLAGALLADGDGRSRLVGLFLVVLNAINLLPVIPLDGGQLWNLVLFSRRPAWEAGFRVVAGVVLVAAGLRFGEPVAPLFGVLTLVGVPVAWRRARFAVFARTLPHHDDGTFVRAGLSWLRRAFPGRSNTQHFATLRALRETGFPDPPSLGESALLLATWGSLVFTALQVLRRVLAVTSGHPPE